MDPTLAWGAVRALPSAPVLSAITLLMAGGGWAQLVRHVRHLAPRPRFTPEAALSLLARGMGFASPPPAGPGLGGLGVWASRGNAASPQRPREDLFVVWEVCSVAQAASHGGVSV